MNLLIPTYDDSNSSSESRSTTYCALPKFRHDKNTEIVNKLQKVSDYIKHLENRCEENEDDLRSNVSSRHWNSFLADSKELHSKLHAASIQCCTLQKKFQRAKTLLKDEPINHKQENHVSPEKTTSNRQKSVKAAILLQPPCHLPTLPTNIETPQSVMSIQSQGSTAFSIKTLGHYCRMFAEVTGKQKKPPSASNLGEIHRTLQTCVDETIRKICNLNYQLSCSKDGTKRHQLQFQLNHLANEVELKRAQMAKLEQFIREDLKKMKNANSEDTITTKLRHGDEIQVVTTIKTLREDPNPLCISHVSRRNQSESKYHSCIPRTSKCQLNPSHLSWQ